MSNQGDVDAVRCGDAYLDGRLILVLVRMLLCETPFIHNRCRCYLQETAYRSSQCTISMLSKLSISQ